MASKITIICFTLCLIQTITSQYINVASPNTFSNKANSAQLLSGSANTAQLLSGSANSNILANSATGKTGRTSVLTVTSTSPISPVGLSVYAENIMLEGPMAVSGQVPFLGTVGFEGSLDTAGQGTASCGCGDASVGIVSEGLGGANYGARK